MKMFASLTAKTTSVPSAPIIHVKAITLRDRMSTIPDLHPEAASLILDSEYTDLNGRKIPLFAKYPLEIGVGGKYVYDFSEIIEIIRVYDVMSMKWTHTGGPDDPLILDNLGRNTADASPDAPSKEVLLEKFRGHINTLILNKESKLRSDTLLPEDSVYQNPNLEHLRIDEMKKIDLMGRRKVSIKGNCIRKNCKSTELYSEEKVVRSGDEPPVTFRVCAICEYKWRF